MSRKPQSSRKDDQSKPNSNSGKSTSTSTFLGFFNKYPELFSDVSKLNYSLPIDTKINLGEGVGASDLHSIPGVVSITFCPMFGGNMNVNSPFNIAMRNLYAFTRANTSGTKYYDAPDQWATIAAGDSLFQFIAMCKRAYGVAKLYSPTNRYYPTQLLYAMGFDAESVIENLRAFKGKIDAMVAATGNLLFPSGIGYQNYHYKLCSEMYTDNLTTKTQTYIFSPSYFWVFNETDSDEGSMLQTIRVPRSITVDSCLEVFHTLYDPIVGSESIGVITADLLRTFSIDQMHIETEVPEDYFVTPTIDVGILTALRNASISDIIGNGGEVICAEILDNLRVVQYHGDLTAGTYFSYEDNSGHGMSNLVPPTAWGKQILLSPFVNPSQDDTFMATRFMTACDIASDEDYSGFTCGSEVITSAEIYYYDYASEGDNTGQFIPKSVSIDSWYNSGYAEYATFPQRVMNYINCSFAPKMFVQFESTVGTDSKVKRTVPLFDIDQYAITCHKEIAEMHNVALLSLLHVPQIGGRN